MACLLSFVIELACLFLLSLLALIFTVNFGHNHYIMVISKKGVIYNAVWTVVLLFSMGRRGLGGGVGGAGILKCNLNRCTGFVNGLWEGEGGWGNNYKYV